MRQTCKEIETSALLKFTIHTTQPYTASYRENVSFVHFCTHSFDGALIVHIDAKSHRHQTNRHTSHTLRRTVRMFVYSVLLVWLCFVCAQSHIQISAKPLPTIKRPRSTAHTAQHSIASFLRQRTGYLEWSASMLLSLLSFWTCVCMLLGIIKVAFVSIKQTTQRWCCVCGLVFSHTIRIVKQTKFPALITRDYPRANTQNAKVVNVATKPARSFMRSCAHTNINTHSHSNTKGNNTLQPHYARNWRKVYQASAGCWSKCWKLWQKTYGFGWLRRISISGGSLYWSGGTYRWSCTMFITPIQPRHIDCGHISRGLIMHRYFRCAPFFCLNTIVTYTHARHMTHTRRRLSVIMWPMCILFMCYVEFI